MLAIQAELSLRAQTVIRGFSRLSASQRVTCANAATVPSPAKILPHLFQQKPVTTSHRLITLRFWKRMLLSLMGARALACA